MTVTSIIARRVHFSCGHRYFNPKMSEEENKKEFGLCYSEHGHGHNYILEGYFQGPIQSQNGMVINLRDIDLMLKKVTDPLDHHQLNNDVEFFKTNIPTTENIARYCFNNLSKLMNQHQGIQLLKVRLHEDEDLWVEYSHDEMVGF